MTTNERKKLQVQNSHLKYAGDQFKTLDRYYLDINVNEVKGVWEFRGAKWFVDSIIDRTDVSIKEKAVKKGQESKTPCISNHQVGGFWYLVVWSSFNGEKYVK